MNKPPLGVSPHWYVYHQRMIELAACVFRHLEYISQHRSEDHAQRYESIAHWSEELKTLDSLEARYYKEE